MRRTSGTIATAVVAVAIGICVLDIAPASAQRCRGDCNNDGDVNVGELIMGVNIALGQMQMLLCGAFDANDDERITVDELIVGVKSALNGCPINLQAKTFRSVQQIFSQSCAFSTCHSPIARQGGLVLSSEQISWSSLVDVDPQHPEAMAMGLKRVASGDPENSFLIRKLRAMGPGDSMPQAGGLLSDEIIDVIEAWIERGAHDTLEECEALGEETAFEGGGAHAGEAQTVCDAEPIDPGDFEWVPEPALPVPAPSEGIQLYVPPLEVPPGSEWEKCYAFRVDWAQAGRDVGINGFPTIAWQEYRMHEGSHHLLMYTYFGEHTEWDWPEGAFDCSAGNCRNPGICDGQTCTSGRVGESCTTNADCGECPPDGRQILPIGGTQVAGTRYQVLYPQGVGIPVLNPKAVVIANLHYTNPFQPPQPIYSEAWLNLYWHQPGEFKALLDGIFAIGFNDLVVEPYETRIMDTIWQPRGLITGRADAAVFQLFGHMHKRGTRFQIDLVSGGACSVNGNICARDSDCRCRPAQGNCTQGQTCILGPDYEDTTIYRTNSWDNAPVVDYPKPYLYVPKDSGLRWTCEHVNGVEGDPTRPPKTCHDGCTVCGWDPDTRTCQFARGVQLGFHDEVKVYQEGEPMPLAFGELADDDMCNMFGYFIPADLLDRLP
jgi:hypothetical protein